MQAGNCLQVPTWLNLQLHRRFSTVQLKIEPSWDLKAIASLHYAKGRRMRQSENVEKRTLARVSEEIREVSPTIFCRLAPPTTPQSPRFPREGYSGLRMPQSILRKKMPRVLFRSTRLRGQLQAKRFLLASFLESLSKGTFSFRTLRRLLLSHTRWLAPLSVS